MKTTGAIAACAALALTFAACGDDDDDGADGGAATSVQGADVTTPGSEVAPAPTTAVGSATTAAGAVTSAPPGGDVTTASPATGSVDPALAEGCEAIAGAFDAAEGDAPQPSVGDELTDEFKESVRGVIDDLEGIDVESDELNTALDAAIDVGNDIDDSDTWTQELQDAFNEALTEVGAICGPALQTQTT